MIANWGFDQRSGEDVLQRGVADAVSYGKLFISNPDLPERFRTGAPIMPPDPATFYYGEGTGYIDYPSLPA